MEIKMKYILYVICIVLAVLLNNAEAQAQAIPMTITYQYDQLGRLVQITFANNAKIVYTYDASGNRTKHVYTAQKGSYP